MVENKSSLFGADVSLPPIFKPDGSVTHDPAETTCLFAAYSNEKQSDYILRLQIHVILTSFALRSHELLGYMKDLDNSITLGPNSLILVLSIISVLQFYL